MREVCGVLRCCDFHDFEGPLVLGQSFQISGFLRMCRLDSRGGGWGLGVSEGFAIP